MVLVYMDSSSSGIHVDVFFLQGEHFVSGLCFSVAFVDTFLGVIIMST